MPEEGPIIVFYKNGEELSRLIRPNSGLIRTEIEEYKLEEIPTKEVPKAKKKIARTHSTGSIGTTTTGSGISSGKRRRTEEACKEGFLSAMPEWYANVALGLNIQRLLNQERRKVDDMIELRKDVPDKLYENVYAQIVALIKTRTYPNDLAPETRKSAFVACLLDAVVLYIQETFELEPEQLLVESNYVFNIEFAGRNREVKADYVVRGWRKGSEKTIQQFFGVVDCKSANCGLGTKQCIVYMRECAYKLNGSQGVVYGLCSTGVHFSLLKYDRKGDPKNPEHDFQLLEPYRLMFPEMIKEGFWEDWKTNCTKIVHILYSILLDQLNL